MKRLTTLTGKNLPRLSVAKPGWPGHNGAIGIDGKWMPITITPQVVSDFTRVCDQTGLSERLRKD